jgi:hypothetical protein
MLRDVFGVEAEIIVDPRTGTPLVMPQRLRGDVLDPDPTASEPFVTVGHVSSSDPVLA